MWEGGSANAGHLLHEGDKLGRRYLLQRRIGAGGMSVVWQAWDEALQRQVAVKVLDAPLSAGLVDRELIRREARAAARIEHPHAMGVYDIGEAITSGGRLTTYVVMRLLDGRSLADLLDEGPLPWPDALEVTVRVAEVLAVAHAHGVVHRDVTPENVMLTSEGAKLLDFGIAAQVGERDDEVRSPLFGTPPYVAPERLRGAQAEGATDMYALGVLLFQMLTGHMPYPEITWDELETARRSGRPPRPTGVPGLPRRVAKICRRCIAEDPAARPTAREVADELADVLAAGPGGLGRRARRLIAAAIAVVALLSVGAVAVFVIASWLAEDGRDRGQSLQSPAPTISATQLATTSSASASATASPASTSPKPSNSPSPSPSTSASSSTSPPGQTVTQAKAAFFATLERGKTSGAIRDDVARDLRQQVDNLVNNISKLSAGQRHDQLATIRSNVRIRMQNGTVTESLAAELDGQLVALNAAMDREAGTGR